MLYKVTDYFTAECGAELARNDPELGMDWPLSEGK